VVDDGVPRHRSAELRGPKWYLGRGKAILLLLHGAASLDHLLVVEAAVGGEEDGVDGSLALQPSDGSLVLQPGGRSPRQRRTIELEVMMVLRRPPRNLGKLVKDGWCDLRGWSIATSRLARKSCRSSGG